MMNTDAMVKMLGLSEFQNPLTGLNFQGTGALSTPLGAELLRASCVDAGKIIGLDRRYALEMVQAGDVLTDYDKLIDRQMERAAVSAVAGFAQIYGGAAQGLSY